MISPPVLEIPYAEVRMTLDTDDYKVQVACILLQIQSGKMTIESVIGLAHLPALNAYTISPKKKVLRLSRRCSYYDRTLRVRVSQSIQTKTDFKGY